MDEPIVVKRIVWMTPAQRTSLKEIIQKTLTSEPDNIDGSFLTSVIHELDTVKSRERISWRLVRNHVSGLRLPNDALPVRVTDEEAAALLKLNLKDRTLTRMLQPGPIREGRR